MEKYKNSYEQLITEEICCNINQACDGKSKVIWEAIGVLPFASIKIKNTSDCIMIVTISKNNEQPLYRIILHKSEKVLTVSCIKKIEMRCFGLNKDKKCTGCFGLMLHYPFEICKKQEHIFCRTNIKKIRNG